MTLERFPCFGTCLTYKLTISVDGSVLFEPKEDFTVVSDGVIKSRINKDQLVQIISEFEKIKFFSLKNTYGRSWKLKSSKTCPEVRTDRSSAEISFRMKGKKKKVWHYHGCQGTETVEKLSELEDRIDEIVNTEQWLEQMKRLKQKRFDELVEPN